MLNSNKKIALLCCAGDLSAHQHRRGRERAHPRLLRHQEGRAARASRCGARQRPLEIQAREQGLFHRRPQGVRRQVRRRQTQGMPCYSMLCLPALPFSLHPFPLLRSTFSNTHFVL